jgi:hypothetical protein
MFTGPWAKIGSGRLGCLRLTQLAHKILGVVVAVAVAVVVAVAARKLQQVVVSSRQAAAAATAAAVLVGVTQAAVAPWTMKMSHRLTATAAVPCPAHCVAAAVAASRPAARPIRQSSAVVDVVVLMSL